MSTPANFTSLFNLLIIPIIKADADLLGKNIMYNPSDLELVEKYNQRFGEIAVKRGFINNHHVAEALEKHMSDSSSTRHRPLKLISEILLYNGWMTFEQVLAVLEELFQNLKEHQSK